MMEALAVVFGMALNAAIGTLFVPVFWRLMQTLREKFRRKPQSRIFRRKSRRNEGCVLSIRRSIKRGVASRRPLS